MAIIDDWRNPISLPSVKDMKIKTFSMLLKRVCFYLTMPSRSLVCSDESRHGSKSTKEYITAMTECYVAGEKLPLLVIGKSDNPHCFRDVKSATFSTTFKDNRRARMTSELFIDWLNKINNKIVLQKHKILMFVWKITKPIQQLNSEMWNWRSTLSILPREEVDAADNPEVLHKVRIWWGVIWTRHWHSSLRSRILNSWWIAPNGLIVLTMTAIQTQLSRLVIRGRRTHCSRSIWWRWWRGIFLCTW